jgi:hypothetical protein
VAVALLPQELDGSQDERMAGAAVRVAAVSVVGAAVPVEGDADPDVELVEQVEMAGGELDSVGVDPQVQRGDSIEGRGELLADAAQTGRSRQQRLPSVQDH